MSTTVLLLALASAPTLSDVQARELAGDADGALQVADAVSLKHPTLALARLESGRLRLVLGREPERAAHELDVARTLAPENPRAQWWWALASLEQGNVREARAALERALELREDLDEARARLAGLCAEALDWPCALTHERWLASRPGTGPGPWLRLAAAQEQAGALAEAEASLRQVLQRVPAHAVARLRLAAVLERSGRVQEAEALRSGTSHARRELRALPPSGSPDGPSGRQTPTRAKRLK